LVFFVIITLNITPTVVSSDSSSYLKNSKVVLTSNFYSEYFSLMDPVYSLALKVLTLNDYYDLLIIFNALLIFLSANLLLKILNLHKKVFRGSLVVAALPL
jgi:hypothetical protein